MEYRQAIESLVSRKEAAGTIMFDVSDMQAALQRINALNYEAMYDLLVSFQIAEAGIAEQMYLKFKIVYEEEKVSN